VTKLKATKSTNHDKEAFVKKTILLGLVLIPMMFLVLGCGKNTVEAPIPDVGIPVAPTQPPPTLPPPTLPPDLCALYEGLEFKIVVHSIYPGDTTVTTYSKFPDTAVGYGDDTFEYYAMLGDEESLDCMIFEGEELKDRVYCMFKFGKKDWDSARHYKLMVNECDEIIHEVPMLSLMVEGDDTTSGSGGTSGSDSPSCGAPPDPNCAGKYEAWCNCMGGSYSCISEIFDNAVCWAP
jgi:hypothetical protein